MLEFMAAVYNEEEALPGLIDYISPYVDWLVFCDDGSTDNTTNILERQVWKGEILLEYKTIKHTGLPETVKAEALKMCNRDSWVIMLDADERFDFGVMEQIVEFVKSPMANQYTHVWFTLHEYLDGQYTGRTFLKCRLFRARDAHFSDTVHVSDWFNGEGANFGWVVNHVKTTEKQIRREKEYIETYKKLVSEGKMTEEKMRETIGMHYFVK
jgi:glycosyltransferase involved in cell wall biosynthesis